MNLLDNLKDNLNSSFNLKKMGFSMSESESKSESKSENMNERDLDSSEEMNQFEEVESILKENSGLNDQDVQDISNRVLNIKSSLETEQGKENFKKFQELEYFESNLLDNQNTLFNKINKTTSTLGKTLLKDILIHPTNDLKLLKNRKNILQFWLENPDKLKKIRNTLSDLKASEKEYMWFFKPLSPEMEKVLEMVYFDNFWSRWINTNESTMRYYYIFQLIIYPAYGVIGPILLMVLPYIFVRFLYGIKIPFEIYWLIVKKMIFGGGGMFDLVGKVIQSGGKGTNIPNKSLKDYVIDMISFLFSCGIINLLYYLFTFGTYFYGIYNSIQISISLNNVTNFIHMKLNKLRSLVVQLQHIFDECHYFESEECKLCMKKEPLFKKEQFASLWDPIFEEDPSIFSNKGKILKQFYLLKEGMTLLEPYLKYLGHLDCWTSIVDLYLENKDTSKCKLCIPTFNESSTPELKIEKFWNIMIPKKDNVQNDLIMGGTGKETNTRNMIITGPNAAGKSTSLKAIIEAVLLSQTICLAPSQSIVLTPFKNINTYLNIPDCQGKESLFQAEMSRCYQQINQLKEMNSGELAFTIMDEIFVSTNYFEGLSGAYAISNKMGKFKNSLCIITTHYPVLSKIQNKNPDFENYYFPIEYKPNNQIIKTYTLTKGQSKEHLAIHLLEKKGFDLDIINDAKKMYKYLIKKDQGQSKGNTKKQTQDKKKNDKNNIKMN